MGTPGNAQARKSKDDRWSPVRRANTGEATAKKDPVGFLNMLAEVRSSGQVMTAAQATGWEMISSIVDSGAAVPVGPPSLGSIAGYELEESPASKAGVVYEVANGAEIPNLGQKFLAVVTAEGTIRGYSTQCADVTKPLQAVRALLANKHAVVFDEEGSFIYNKVSGELNMMRDDGVNYYLDQWVIPKDQIAQVIQAAAGEPDFIRQG